MDMECMCWTCFILTAAGAHAGGTSKGMRSCMQQMPKQQVRGADVQTVRKMSLSWKTGASCR